MLDVFDFVAANWGWLIATAVVLTYLLKGAFVVKQWERVPVTRLLWFRFIPVVIQ